MNPIRVEEAFKRGYLAGYNGIRQADCPYPSDTAEAKEWTRAYRRGASMARTLRYKVGIVGGRTVAKYG